MHRQYFRQTWFVTGEREFGKEHQIGTLACSQVDEINVFSDVFFNFAGAREYLRSNQLHIQSRVHVLGLSVEGNLLPRSPANA
ncbi:hypothetical protein D3C84_865150 [compost metagenome]